MDLRERLVTSASVLLARVPGVRDGDVEAIHDARVATRRMRAVLSILSVCEPDADVKEVARTVRRAGRALGRARDLDVSAALLTELERRLPAAASRAADVRRAIVERREKARRRLVKELDRLPLEELVSIHTRPRPGHRFFRRAEREQCDGPIRAALLEQSVALRQAIERGSGVYFPKRAHTVRIDTKKLRYVLEMSSDPDAIAPKGLKRLRRAQEILGSLHDREVLREQFGRVAAGGDEAGLAAAESALAAECRELFAQYVARRAGLLEVCDAVERYAAPAPAGHRRATWLRIATVAVPAAAALVVGVRRPRALAGH